MKKTCQTIDEQTFETYKKTLWPQSVIYFWHTFSLQWIKNQEKETAGKILVMLCLENNGVVSSVCGGVCDGVCVCMCGQATIINSAPSVWLEPPPDHRPAYKVSPATFLIDPHRCQSGCTLLNKTLNCIH